MAAPFGRAASRDEARARLAEIGEILAAGLVRLRGPKSSEISADTGESSLDFTPDQSGHAQRNGEGE